jgi:hypothetical protein
MSAPARYTSVGARIRDLEAVNADLLAALHEVVDAWERYIGVDDTEGHNDVDDVAAAVGGARAAIEKARG